MPQAHHGRMLLSFLLVLSSSLLPNPSFPAFSTTLAQGNVYYVATDGSDTSGDGSIAMPWATITHGLDSVPDDSTILVRPGTYSGRVALRGTFGQGVTVRSEMPCRALVRHTDTAAEDS